MSIEFFTNYKMTYTAAKKSIANNVGGVDPKRFLTSKQLFLSIAAANRWTRLMIVPFLYIPYSADDGSTKVLSLKGEYSYLDIDFLEWLDIAKKEYPGLLCIAYSLAITDLIHEGEYLRAIDLIAEAIQDHEFMPNGSYPSRHRTTIESKICATICFMAGIAKTNKAKSADLLSFRMALNDINKSENSDIRDEVMSVDELRRSYTDAVRVLRKNLIKLDSQYSGNALNYTYLETPYISFKERTLDEYESNQRVFEDLLIEVGYAHSYGEHYEKFCKPNISVFIDDPKRSTEIIRAYLKSMVCTERYSTKLKISIQRIWWLINLINKDGTKVPLEEIIDGLPEIVRTTFLEAAI